MEISGLVYSTKGKGCKDVTSVSTDKDVARTDNIRILVYLKEVELSSIKPVYAITVVYIAYKPDTS